MRRQNASVVKLDVLVQTARHVAHRWKAVAARGTNALLHTAIKAATIKNRKDHTTGERKIGRQQKKQCDATHTAEGWRGHDRDAGPLHCGTQRTGPGSVEIADKSSRLHD